MKVVVPLRVLGIVVALTALVALTAVGCTRTGGSGSDGGDTQGGGGEGAARITAQGLSTDTSKASIEMDRIVGGGPPKDGIPALTEPLKFTDVAEADLPDDTLGILYTTGSVHRYYPYPILAWHEVVNDSIDEDSFVVTF